ncbi:MAG TPA: hypothetical protein VM617_05440 [Thermoanaerobaculia bacterium]|nr:hypothetical protein [Thermoanaerobaculia bacterium]
MRLARRLLLICLLVAPVVPATALTPPELTGSVSPVAPTTSDLVEVSLFHASRDCPLRPSDVVVVAAAPPGEGYDGIVRVQLARQNGQFLCQAMSGTDFLPIGPSFAIGPLAAGEYLVEAVWDGQLRAATAFIVSGPPPVREGSGPFARPLPSTAAHEIVIEDVPGLDGCAPRTFDPVATQVDGTLVHVFFEERSFSLTCPGPVFPGDVRAVVGPLPSGASYTAVVWFLPDVPILKPQILWGTAPLLGAGSEGTCATAPHELCLGGRFVVRVRWATAQDQGFGEPVPLTRDTGAFWFFDRDNLELVVKALDACGPFGRHWIFLSGLTDVEVEIEVVDSTTGERRTYRNEAGEDFQPRFDTDAFGCP